MSTENAVAEVATAEAHDFTQSGMDLEAAFKAAGVGETTEVVTEKKPEEKKPEVVVNDGTEDFPEQLITGKKPEEKKEELSEFEKVMEAEPPDRLSKEGKINWKLVRDAARTAAQERDAVRKELADLRAKASNAPDEATAAELKVLRERTKELESVVEKSHFEKSPRFQQFLNREAQQIEGAKKYLEGSTIDPNVIELAAKAVGKKRIDILKDAGADAEIIAAITPYLAQYDSIQSDKAHALENHKQIIEQDSVNQRRDAEAKAAQERENEDKVFKSVGENVSKTFEPFQKVDGNEKWNAQVDRLNAEAREFFSGDMPIEKVAEIAYYGVGAKVIHEMNHRLRAKLQSANAEIASLKAAQPSVNGTESKETTSEREGEDYLAGAARRFNEASGR